jgi:hypothetical protein
MLNIDCNVAVENYLLNLNPLYVFSFPIAVLVSIIVFGVSKAYNWSNNSYIIQILIPILTLLIIMILIEFISRAMILSKDREKLLEMCNDWKNDDKIKKNSILQNFIDMDIILNYQKNKKENFTNLENSAPYPEEIKIINDSTIIKNSEENVEANQDFMSHLSPYPLQFRDVKSKCVDNSSCCNLCSGANDNPCNVNVAPIPSPIWMPQSAESVQNRLKNNEYTLSKCDIR